MGERMVGHVLLGKYEVVSFQGLWFAGGTFTVRSDVGSGKTYVAKMVHPQYIKNSTELDLYAAAVENWMSTSHPNVAKVLEIGKDESGVPIIVREFFDGLHLQYVFNKEDMTFDLPDAAFILEGILQGLSAVHDAGVKSGRLTASDVFLIEGEKGDVVVKVGDFGEYLLESIRNDMSEQKDYVKFYRAPEQVRENTTEFASDIFAAGVILYRLLTGRFPYPSGIPAKPEKVPGFVSVTELKPGVPSVIDYNLRRAMAIFPRDRFKGAAQFAKTLKGLLPENPIVYKDILTRASIAPEAAVKAQAAKVPVVKKSGRPRMDTIKFDQQVFVPPPEIASATTQQFDSSVPGLLEESIERHSSTPESPPGSVEVPYDNRPDAWKEERKLVPRSSKTPSRPPPAADGESLEMLDTAEVEAPPPVDVAETVRKISAAPEAVEKAPQAFRAPPASRAGAAPQEESLAPIMPSRHVKWFVVVGIVLAVLFLGWAVKSFFFGGGEGEGDKGGTTVAAGDEKKDAESSGEEDGGATSEGEEEETEEAKDDAGVDAEAEPSGLLEGLVVSKDEQEEEEVAAGPEEEKVEVEKVTIKLKVTPSKATVYFNGEKAKKPYILTVDKSSQTFTVKVEYTGYETWESSVTAEEDRAINVALVKLKPPEIEKKPDEKEEVVSKPKETKKKKGKKGRKGKKKSGIVEDVPF